MSDNFASAHQKLAWGRKHISELERELAAFLKVSPGKIIGEPHPDKPGYRVYKLRMARPLPPEFSMIAGDAVDNLRASLDHAMFTIAIAAAPLGRKVEHAYFPFAGSATWFENQLKRCSDIPFEMWPFLRTLQPYKGGNPLLVALNDASNRNKHALILSVAAISRTMRQRVQGISGEIRKMADVPIWDRTKQEMELLTTGSDAKFDAEFNFQFIVTLDEVPISEHALTALYAIASEVERILLALEAESRRLGLIK
jgi:hypothetical protein